MKSQQRITAKTIAEQLGLSIATVDRVLNNRGNVKEATRRKVLDKAEELGYTPNKLARFLSRKKEYKIAVIYGKAPKYFWEQIELGIEKAYDELADFGLKLETYRYPSEDSSVNAEFIKQIVETKEVEGIALAAGDEAYVHAIDYGIDKGIPIFTFNNDSPESKRLNYIGSDYRNSGRLAAELLCKFIGMNGKIALILDTEFVYQSREKVAGFREVLKEYPHVEMIGPLKIEPSNPLASLEKLKETISSVSGIYVANAQLTNTAKHLEEHLKQNLVLIGHDMNEEIYEYLNKGIITATISQDPINQGYMTVYKLFEYITEANNVKNEEIITKLEVVMKENAKFYI